MSLLRISFTAIQHCEDRQRPPFLPAPECNISICNFNALPLSKTIERKYIHVEQIQSQYLRNTFILDLKNETVSLSGIRRVYLYKKINMFECLMCLETYLHVLETILLADTPEHILLATLLHFSCEQKFVQNKVCFLKVEDDVQLAHIPIVLVHLLDVTVDYLKGNEFVVG